MRIFFIIIGFLSLCFIYCNLISLEVKHPNLLSKTVLYIALPIMLLMAYITGWQFDHDFMYNAMIKGTIVHIKGHNAVILSQQDFDFLMSMRGL